VSGGRRSQPLREGTWWVGRGSDGMPRDMTLLATTTHKTEGYPDCHSAPDWGFNAVPIRLDEVPNEPGIPPVDG